MVFLQLQRRVCQLCVVLGVLALFGCNADKAVTFDQTQLDQLAESLVVHYQLTDNQATDSCAQAGFSECFTATLSLTFAAATPANGWALYFSHLTPLASVDSEAVTIEHINGDLHRFVLAQDVAAGESLVIPVVGQFWHVNRSDIVPNMYLDGEGLSARLVQSTLAVEDPNTGINIAQHVGHFAGDSLTQRGADDQLPRADSAWLYDYYTSFADAAQTSTSASSDNIPRVIPDVLAATWQDQRVELPQGVNVSTLLGADVQAALDELSLVGLAFNKDGMPVFWKPALIAQEHYGLSINGNVITINAADIKGVRYALLTLAQLFDKSSSSLPMGKIEDAPAFVYRGMHFDIARNFPGKDAIFQLLDEMFISKLNRLHLHFADDEGWRIAIREFPELTQLGAFRCADDEACLMPQLGSGPQRSSSVNGYLTEADYIALIQYAAARNIEIIPSFDTPGHARAAVKAMESRFQASGDDSYRLLDPLDTTTYSSIQYYNDNTLNPCIESSYVFVDSVIGRLQTIHQQAGSPLKTFHLGADETAGAWIESPACQALLNRSLTKDDVHHLLGLFVQRVYQLTKARGLTLAGWNDGMGSIPVEQRSAHMLATIWTTLAAGGDAVAAEWNQSAAHSVYSFPDVLYFDFPYQNHPDEPGYYWASKNTDLFKVFQFTPQALPVHQWLWTDRKGHPFKAGNALTAATPLGIQGQVWSEAIRSPATLEYMLYPRLYALGERAWSTPPWQQQAQQVVRQNGTDKDVLITQQKQAWQGFIQQLVAFHLPRLANNDINFRIPPPGVKMQGEQVVVASLYPELLIEVAHEGQWKPFTHDLPVSASSQFRSRFAGAQQASRPVCLNQCSAESKRKPL